MVKWSRIAVLIGIALIFSAFYIFYTWYYQSIPQSGIGLLGIIPNPRKPDVVLVFAPHPDDETIAAGGFIKTATKAKAEVWVVLVTDGNKHHLEKTRYNEFADVTSYLGIPENHLIYLDYPDGSLSRSNQSNVKAYFKNIIRFVHPNIILSPSINDRHPDHKTTGEDVNEILSGVKIKARTYYYLVHFPNFPLPIDFNKNLYILPPLRLLDLSKEWLSFPLTSDVEEAKYNALMKYKTQLKYPLPKELILTSIRRNELFEVDK